MFVPLILPTFGIVPSGLYSHKFVHLLSATVKVKGKVVPVLN
jgi:hypothetical protein